MFESPNRIVAQTDIGRIQISTVFLGLNHRYFGDGPPLIFETMIFGGKHDGYQSRSSTWEEAEKEHAEAIALATPPRKFVSATLLVFLAVWMIAIIMFYLG